MLTPLPLVLDACVVLNLAASGKLEEIVLFAAPRRLVASAAASECLRLADSPPGDNLDLSGWFRSGALEHATLANNQEEALFVGFAASLGDGESMSLAIAAARNFALATDDAKATRIAHAYNSHFALFTTPDLLHAWARNAPRPKVSAALRAIELRARYRPGPQHPLKSWWRQQL